MQSRIIDPTIFRSYDIRGIWNKTVDSMDFEAIGKAFASELIGRGGKSVCISYDVRHSSKEILDALTKALIGSGIDVINIGMGPSPMLYFAQKYLDTDAGLMITGSHNPQEYNGLKICLKEGPFFGEDILRLREIASSGEFIEGVGRLSEIKLLDKYIDYLIKDFNLHYISGKKLKIAWDPANGAGCKVVSELIKKLPGEHIILNGIPDGSFPSHHPDPCVESNMTQLKQVVLEQGCDLGIGFDGDADRIGVLDGKGRHLMGDQLLTYLSEEIAISHPSSVVLADVKSSKVLFDRLYELGLTSHMTKTGHSHIKALMKQLKCPLAGEMSGHIFFADRYYGFDDGIYAALRLIGSLSLREDSLAEWFEQLPKTYITPEMWHICEDDLKFKHVERVTNNLKEQGATFCDADGVRVTTKDGWWLLRASNTQAVLVSRAESQTEEGLKRLKSDISHHLNELGILIST